MGKKYIIELEDKVSENAKGDKLYFVKGFNNLSLDEGALKKLEELRTPHEYEVGDVIAYDVRVWIITCISSHGYDILNLNRPYDTNTVTNYDKEEFVWSGINERNNLESFCRLCQVGLEEIR